MNMDARESLAYAGMVLMVVVVAGVTANLIWGELWISISIGLAYLVGFMMLPVIKAWADSIQGRMKGESK